MSFTKCPLCGQPVDVSEIHPGNGVLCPGCHCTFPAPRIRRKKSLKKKPVKKTSKTGRRPQSKFGQFATKNQRILLFWGKLGGMAAVGLIVAIVVIQGMRVVGENLARKAQAAAVEKDIRSAYSTRLAVATMSITDVQAGKGPIIIAQSFEMDWDKAESGNVPFTANLEDFVDSRNRMKFNGTLDRTTGEWTATSDPINLGTLSHRLELHGKIAPSDVFPPLLILLIAAVAVATVVSLLKVVFRNYLLTS